MSNTTIEDLGYLVSNDAIKLLIGQHLGDGQFRRTFVLKTDESRVIKIETGSGSFENVAEWDIWNSVRKSKWAQWFAPVYHISPWGSCLIQARCQPLKDRPKLVPDFFCDLKDVNWGTLNGKIVCFDYGHHKFYGNGIRKARLTKAKFRN
jgi:hypothetical protein